MGCRFVRSARACVLRVRGGLPTAAAARAASGGDPGETGAAYRRPRCCRAMAPGGGCTDTLHRLSGYQLSARGRAVVACCVRAFAGGVDAREGAMDGAVRAAATRLAGARRPRIWCVGAAHDSAAVDLRECILVMRLLQPAYLHVL